MRRLTVFFIVGLLGAACSGGETTTTGVRTTTTSGEGGRATSINVGSDDNFRFAPDSWSAAAGQDVTVTFTNSGSIPHDWVILKAGTTITSRLEYDDSLAELTLIALGGQSVTGTFNLPVGTHQVICLIPGHFERGMEGSLQLNP